MTEVDLAALRASVMQLNWVRMRACRASCRTRSWSTSSSAPRTRCCASRAMLELIDATGHELEPVSQAKAKGLLLISGPGAQSEVEALDTPARCRAGAAPASRREAEWIGNRRWNLTFKSGQVLALPEGGDNSAKALIDFARLDGVNRLIGGKVVAFDMRTPGRIYMRCPQCAAENKPPLVEGGTT